MKAPYKKSVFTLSVLLISLFFAGCEQPEVTSQLAPDIELGATIGSFVEVFAPETIGVEGYALVGGLSGTGSAECPSQLRDYLKRYILRQMPEQRTDIEKFIASSNTAVVRVYGQMPILTAEKHFDVMVEALAGTQTTSLEGGWLYGAELKPAGAFARSLKVLAKADGPVFIDTIDAQSQKETRGYILAGGTALEKCGIMLALRRPDYRTANAIRNRLNGRYGYQTARAVSDSQIELEVPEKYKGQQQRFISLVRATYLNQNPEVTNERILTSVRKLATSGNKEESEIVLETIGKGSLGKLSALLGSFDQEVRFRTARCMLNLGSEAGLDALRQIAFDKTSPYRIGAMEAISASADYSDATAILRRLLRDDSFVIRLAAYEKLRKADDISITRDLVAGDFYLEQITQSPKKGIFVARSGQPRIVLFGAPIYCRYDSFVQSDDGSITINAPAGKQYVSITRKHPKRPDVLIQLKSSFELGDIIHTLAEAPTKKTDKQRVGLGVSYAEVISILKRMSEKGAIPGQFRAGPLPKIGSNIKRKEPLGR